MMLCFDCGNTRVKWGLRDGARWRATGVLTHDEVDGFVPPEQALQSVVGCNVAGQALAHRIEARLEQPVVWITAASMQCGVTNGYERPTTLGADRWAALVGARALHAGPNLVVLSGTATTIDVLDAGGRHHGGVILPGLAMMANSLAAGTAALPKVNVAASDALPRNTRDAIASGALFATAGAIQRMFAHLAREPEPLCLLSGGAAELVLPLLDIPVRRVEHLVLEGLVAITEATG